GCAAARPTVRARVVHGRRRGPRGTAGRLRRRPEPDLRRFRRWRVSDPIRILGIYAHPADLATEAAGTMAIHADRGHHVSAYVMSDGIRMHPHFLQKAEGREPMTLADYREFKRDEVRRASTILGMGDVAFMGW